MAVENHLESGVNSVLRIIIDTALGSVGFAIRARQRNAPRPATAYATVGLISDIEIGYADMVQSNIETMPNVIDVRESSETIREMNFSINFFYEGAHDNAHMVRTALQKTSINNLLLNAGLSLINASSILDVSEALENSWEERANLDVLIGATGSTSDILYGINSLEVGLIVEMRKQKQILQLGIS